MTGAVADIVLTEADIPGASLREPLEVHNVAALKWWLLCRGVQVSSSCKKPDLIERYAVLHTCLMYYLIYYCILLKFVVLDIISAVINSYYTTVNTS